MKKIACWNTISSEEGWLVQNIISPLSDWMWLMGKTEEANIYWNLVDKLDFSWQWGCLFFILWLICGFICPNPCDLLLWSKRVHNFCKNCPHNRFAGCAISHVCEHPQLLQKNKFIRLQYAHVGAANLLARYKASLASPCINFA